MTIAVKLDPAKRHGDGLAKVTLCGAGLDGTELDLPFEEVFDRFGAPNGDALDLLLVASLCYVIDKVVGRKSSVDAWTRELSVELPVSNPERWNALAGEFDAALMFLTGDIWSTSFRSLECDLFKRPKKRRRRRMGLIKQAPMGAVGLFSGGLDSLIGAIDFLEVNPKERILLLGHYDSSGPRSQQVELHEHLRSQYPGRTSALHVRVSHKPFKNAEPSLRSRSLVFMALGIYAASAYGHEVPLYASENGLIALNAPLTPSRAGSCSTRTMHPCFLKKVRSLVKQLGFENPIVNEYQLKTKADCVLECRNATILGALARTTVSCSHGSRRQHWTRKGANNCGYCVPCLFRRASLHIAGWDDGLDYGIDVCSGELEANSDLSSADDVRALAAFLRTIRSARDAERAITRVASVDCQKESAQMLLRGVEQIRSWINEKGTPSLRTAAGL